MFMLRLRMYILMALMFGIVYAIISSVSYLLGVSNFMFYLILSLVMMFIQYMIGPKIVEWSMGVGYIKENEYPNLHKMVEELAKNANIPKPRIGIAKIRIPNAFAFGRWKSDSRVCVTEGVLDMLSPEELKAVLGHEISHIKNRDVLTITLLSVIPVILYRIAWSMIYYRGDRRRAGGNAALIGLAAFIFYFITNLLVLYASRIREYFADRGAVALGNQPHQLASALYKIVYGNARAPKEAVRQVEGLKAFFINDPSRAREELFQLKDLDLDKSGSIDKSELQQLYQKQPQLSFGDKLLEVLSTHPNILKRIKQLSGYESSL